MNKTTLAKKAYMSLASVCNALNGKARLSKGMWENMCRALGLDYEEIIAQLPEAEKIVVDEGVAPEEPEMSTAKEPEEPEPHKDANVQKETDALPKAGVVISCTKSRLKELAFYVEMKLRSDIEAGMKIEPERLYGMLEAWMEIRRASEAKDVQ